MNNKHDVKWQFAPEFYRSLNETLTQIRTFFWQEEYELTLKGLRLVWDIIRLYAKSEEPEMFQDIDALMERAVVNSNTYMNLAIKYSIRTKLPPKVRIRISMVKKDLESDIHELHGLLWSVMFKLKMVLPLEKRDDRAEIYK